MARIRKVAVLGAGVMGSGIAAHIAGAGVPVLLLDIVPPGLTPEEQRDRRARNRLAQSAIDKALAQKPPAFFTPRDAPLVEVGNLEDDLGRIAECDWIIEVVKEDLAIKTALFARVDRHRRPGAIVSSNTSGLPLARMVEGRSPDFRRCFLVTHFFNPVRYMKLLELVLGQETEPEVARRIHRFGEDVLGKGIVYAKDTPNFVANRIGTFAMMDAVRLMLDEDLTIEEVDAILGRPLGRPRSAVFRTADIVGLDTLLHVAINCHQMLERDDQRAVFEPPEFMKEMVRNGMLGDKSGGGFYKKTREGLLALDWKTLEYRPLEPAKFESIAQINRIEDAGERIKRLAAAEDRAGRFAWKALSRTLNYAAWRLGEIADDVVNIDRALRWGFNWDLGPFEVLDALGPKAALERMEREGMRVAPALRELGAAADRFYPGPRTYRDLRLGTEKPIPLSARELRLPRGRRDKIVREDRSATLWDLGDGVLGLELHTKMNSVDDGVIAMLHGAVDEVEKNGWSGLVIGNEAVQAFSAGANLLLILDAARNGRWEELERISREFQTANMRLRYCEAPVVAAPFGLTLGGGAELAMSAVAVRAHAELYMGLVEVGVGLLPASGGVKEMVFRAMAGIPDNVDPYLPISRAFETVATGKVSTSAEDARDLLFLRAHDRVSLSREQLLHDAKQTALGMARAGYRPPRPRTVRVAGETGLANFKVMLGSMREANAISDHDLKIGMHIARVMTGGQLPAGARVGEQRLLDLEREAFLSLCGEPRSQERIEHMLKNNKPLRN